MADTIVFDPLGANIRVMCQRAGLSPDRRVGDIDQASAGNRRSFIAAEYRVAPLAFVNATPAQCKAIKDLLRLGAQIATSGTVWLNDDPDEIVVCDGVYTDEMETGGPWRVPGVTLYEVGDATPFTAGAATYLSNVASPSGGGMNLATADEDEDPFAAGIGSLRLLDAATPATCGGSPDPSVNCPITYTDPGTPEKVWITAATVQDGYLTGRPYVSFLSKGGTGDRWQTQAFKAKLIVVRGGVDVFSIETGYSDTNGGFAGGTSTATAADSTIFPTLIGDRVRVEIYARLGLHGGYADDQPADLARQTISFGNGGAGSHLGRIGWDGLAEALNP
jgi:hypothetical protein